jgi:hypothetical protein
MLPQESLVSRLRTIQGRIVTIYAPFLASGAHWSRVIALFYILVSTKPRPQRELLTAIFFARQGSQATARVLRCRLGTPGRGEGAPLVLGIKGLHCDIALAAVTRHVHVDYHIAHQSKSRWPGGVAWTLDELSKTPGHRVRYA